MRRPRLATVRARRGRSLLLAAKDFAPSRADRAAAAYPELLEMVLEGFAKLVAEALDFDLIGRLHAAEEILRGARGAPASIELLHPQLRLRHGFPVLDVEAAERYREIAERKEAPPQHPPLE